MIFWKLSTVVFRTSRTSCEPRADPVRELDSLSNLPPGQLVFRLGPVDALASERDSLLSFPQYVERLIDHRQRIHVATIGLARPEVFVLELEFWVRAKPGLFLQSLGGRHSLAFGSKRCARLKRSVDGFLLAEPCLRLA